MQYISYKEVSLDGKITRYYVISPGNGRRAVKSFRRK